MNRLNMRTSRYNLSPFLGWHQLTEPTTSNKYRRRCPRWSLGMIHKEVTCPKGKPHFSFQTFIFRGENVNFREGTLLHSHELLGCLMTGSFITRMACSGCTPVRLSYQNPPWKKQGPQRDHYSRILLVGVFNPFQVTSAEVAINCLVTLPETNIAHENPHVSW